jgi:transglutaminase-like putative cysteine protease
VLRAFSLTTLLLAAAIPLTAQAPRITPAGDPSVQSDSIYRLAVNPADHQGEDWVYLLDDGVVRYEKDGTGSRTYRQVVQVFTREAAEHFGEQSFDYVSGREKLTINWLRVLTADGKLISDKPVHEQESIAPVAQEAPVYSDVKERRVSLGGVAPNTIVDFSYTIETVEPVMPADFQNSWRVSTGRLTRRSRYLVDLPADFVPNIEERNLSFLRRVTEANGRKVYLWATGEVAPWDGEPFAADSNTVVETISVSAPLAWSDIAHWYAGLSKDRYAITPSLDSMLTGLLSGARTIDDSLRALDRWVAQDFRYVSLSLGIGGFRPRLPADVLQTKYGDCKDKATLFIAVARHLGIHAYPVLLNSGGGVNRSLPTIGAFDHMIAAVERPWGGYLYVDLTSELTPFGSLPPSEHGQFGLVVHPDGRGEEITFPRDSIGANRDDDALEGALATDGTLSGRYSELQTGTRQYGLRNAFTNQLDSNERSRLGQRIAGSVVPSATSDSVTVFDGRDWSARPYVSVAFHGGRAASASGNTDILTLPLHDYATPTLVTDLEGRGPRRFPINVEAVVGTHEESSSLALTLPTGWRAQLPPNVEATSVFGRYTAEYRQDGRVLRIVRRLVGARGTEPPAKIGDLIAWLKTVGTDDVKYIVLDRGH